MPVPEARPYRRYLPQGLEAYSWFVTGNVDARYFSDAFRFVDPSVQTESLTDYAEGTAKIFDQGDSTMQVADVEVGEGAEGQPCLVVTWRLDARVTLPFRPKVKPFMIETRMYIGEDGLIEAQEDQFLIPAWDVFLSAFIPGIGAPPAPELS
uniref:SnoaL-like domain-containing protein n=1 Tax=Phaeomonas parva TaxID=124430 RepID=A0A7S1UIJ5_9STRA|mmetsp:Transcript_6926/g.20233  ORF Transcript_6926/g.20233 Transcript_6926/m.20233 type:complete len:152 (+) Transcript_6926:261-716(+)